MKEVEIESLKQQLELVEEAKKQASQAMSNARNEEVRLRNEFCRKHSKYKVGQRVKRDAKNIGSAYNPKWEYTDIEMVEVSKVHLQFGGKFGEKIYFSYNLMRVKKDGTVSTRSYERALREEDIDEWN